jgi:hypothetical protein
VKDESWETSIDEEVKSKGDGEKYQKMWEVSEKKGRQEEVNKSRRRGGDDDVKGRENLG